MKFSDPLCDSLSIQKQSRPNGILNNGHPQIYERMARTHTGDANILGTSRPCRRFRKKTNSRTPRMSLRGDPFSRRRRNRHLHGALRGIHGRQLHGADLDALASHVYFKLGHYRRLSGRSVRIHADLLNISGSSLSEQLTALTITAERLISSYSPKPLAV